MAFSPSDSSIDNAPFQDMLLPFVHVSSPGSHVKERIAEPRGLHSDGQALIDDIQAHPVELDCFCS